MRTLLLDSLLLACLACLCSCPALPGAPAPARTPGRKPPPLTFHSAAGAYRCNYCGGVFTQHLERDGYAWAVWPYAHHPPEVWVGRWTLDGDTVTVAECRAADPGRRPRVAWRFRLRRAKGGRLEAGEYSCEVLDTPAGEGF